MTRHTSPQSNSVSVQPPGLWETICLAALFQCRFLVPTEAAELGGTLWLAAVWFGFAAVLFWLRCRESSSILWSPHWSDLGIALIVVGHLCSGLMLFLNGGQLRAATNMIWEWGSLFCLWVLIRTALSSTTTSRALTHALLMSAVVLSGFGLWQHFVLYPQQSQQISELLEFKERVAAHDTLSAEETSRHRTLQQKFGTSLDQLDEQGQLSLIARIRDSVEPIGRFALANSLAALLLAALMVLVPVIPRKFPEWDSTQKFAGIALAMLIVLCLVLTKSRTAWLAAFCGIGLYVGFLRRWQASEPVSVGRSRIVLVAGILATLLLVLVAVGTGGLDPEVISEAPKSLQYRLEYWSSTMQMLKEHPLFGAGPGNFRQNYVKYKLPAASEEVIDPHNFLLDLWANGGLLALIGIVVWGGSLLIRGLSQLRQPDETDSQKLPPSFTIGIQCVSFGLLIGITFLSEGRLDLQLVCLFLGALVVTFVLDRLHLTSGAGTTGAWLGLVALFIHFTASGGIEMPALVQILIMLGAIVVTRSQSMSASQWTILPRWQGVLSLTSAALMIGCLLTGVLPVQAAQARIRLGTDFLTRGTSQYSAKVAAQREFEAAVAADPLDPEPHQMLAQLQFATWKNSGKSDDHSFEQAIAHQAEAVRLDPGNSGGRLRLGQFWAERFQVTKDLADAEQALAAFQASLALYPQDALRLAELAFLQQQMGQSGREMAAQALELDRLKISRGHVDKQLPQVTREKLEAILELSDIDLQNGTSLP